ncbi:MAG: S8 family serine peptidase [Verrucomicrobiales bacterium]|nr:S8 family serine peptidase [Verrucomicrobiales bacterium]
MALVCLWLASGFNAQAANTNLLVWHKAADRVDADVRGEALWPLLEQIAVAADWKIFVEPGAERNVSAKFKDLPSGDALKRLLGDLNFALVPQTNAPSLLYVFRTTMKAATRQVVIAKPARRIANELLLKVKPGTDIEALAKLFGAKVVGRLDKLGLYRLQFADAAATDAALGQLQNNTDVAEVDYNYSFDPPPSAVPLASAPGGQLSLTLNPPGDSGKVIVGLIDMNVQSLGPQLDKFILPQQSVAGDAPANNADITHGTAMAYTILEAIAKQSSGGGSSAQILPVDVYGGNQTTTSWFVALGIQAAVDSGANVLNLSLGSSGDSSVLDGIVKLALANNIVIFGAAGNTPVNTPTYPGAIPGVYAITALSQPGQLAPYANYWSGDSMALPGTSIVYYGNQAYGVQGTSTATAYASGVFAGTKAATGTSSPHIIGAMWLKYPMPAMR